jgi:ubiquinone/menaquinone biosynthesis C-methylase UbiE
MEGPIATWYANNSGRDPSRFITLAEAVTNRVPGGHVLEVAPGPGFCAIEIAKTGRHSVTGLDISESFVRIARENARKAGVAVDFRHGNASAMPFPDAAFDFVVCSAAFKNFSDPIGALNEIHRVLVPGGRASIYDLRKDASFEEIAAEVRKMRLSPFNALLTRWTFRFVLLKRAYSRAALEEMAAASVFGTCDIQAEGIGFELGFAKPSQAGAKPGRADAEPSLPRQVQAMNSRNAPSHLTAQR